MQQGSRLGELPPEVAIFLDQITTTGASILRKSLLFCVEVLRKSARY